MFEGFFYIYILAAEGTVKNILIVWFFILRNDGSYIMSDVSSLRWETEETKSWNSRGMIN